MTLSKQLVSLLLCSKGLNLLNREIEHPLCRGIAAQLVSEGPQTMLCPPALQLCLVCSIPSFGLRPRV